MSLLRMSPQFRWDHCRSEEDMISPRDKTETNYKTKWQQFGNKELRAYSSNLQGKSVSPQLSTWDVSSNLEQLSSPPHPEQSSKSTINHQQLPLTYVLYEFIQVEQWVNEWHTSRILEVIASIAEALLDAVTSISLSASYHNSSKVSGSEGSLGGGGGGGSVAVFNVIFPNWNRV